MAFRAQGLYLPEYEHDSCGAGFICSLKNEKSHEIIHQSLNILCNLEHRGAVSADGRTGDGAGILIEIPHQFFRNACSNMNLPEEDDYAVGMVFLPKKKNQRDFCIDRFEENLENQGLVLKGWRDVPVQPSNLGKIASETEPHVRQVFVAKPDEDMSAMEFDTKLYIARKITENEIAASKITESNFFYIASLSTKTIIYKGLLMPDDISRYYPDLLHPDFKTRFALVHQRFSTNTLPSWDLAQPFRFMCHNGEINTLRGNINRMRAREELLDSELFDDQMNYVLPILQEGKSDSASFDNVLELLLLTGRTLPEVMMMLVPEAWEKHQSMSDEKKAFYEYSSCLMEPWDGPASIPFTDGKYIGAILDRNGLRPSRYTVTKSGYIVMSSETGVLNISPENVEYHGRLEPGKMFLVNMEEGRIVGDEEIKNQIVNQFPYRDWLNDNFIHLEDLEKTEAVNYQTDLSLITRMQLFGYTHEDIETIIEPMAQNGKEPLGSMGTDTPLAVLSSKSQLLYNYFKQLFAQVTNPPLDGIREELITDISLMIGKDKNLFEIGPDHCRVLKIDNPVISNEELQRIRNLDSEDFKSATISMTYEISKGLNGLEEALKNMNLQIADAVEEGASIIILSDRDISKEKAPIPALLSCSNVQHGLQKLKKRSQVGIIIESAEPREVHHFALLFGYGASAINPYMVNEIIREQFKISKNIPEKDAVKNFNKAIGKGVLKVMNKIGISTLHSYRGAQIFECIGINKRVVDKYFPHTASRIEGIGLYEMEREIAMRHEQAFHDPETTEYTDIEMGGEYRWRRNGEKHAFNPATVAKLQEAVRQNKFDTYEEYSRLVNEQNKHLMTLRGLLEFANRDPIHLDEVEPWTEIVKRFKTGAMSYGSISLESHETLAIAMNRIGGKSNSGEGGENEDRFYRDSRGNWRNSAIKQVASGRFGVSINYLTNAKEIQIKMAQGAKPGEGGQLPGHKVNEEIASCRNSTPYVGLISPPPHHDIYSIEDLAQLIYDLKCANRRARINVKLVSKVGVGTIAAGVAKAKADVILISGYDGGTGASPLTSLKHAGLPWELGIAEAQQTLVLNDLRGRVILECDGQLKTGRDVAIACLLGAEEFGFSTAPLVATGCIMMRVCHLNTCPVGIATQNPELRKKFEGKPEHVINFMYFVAQELRQIMAELGYRTIREMIGQSQKLNFKPALDHFKARGIDLSSILHKPQVKKGTPLCNTEEQNHFIEESLDFKILELAHPAIYRQTPSSFELPIKNTDRTTGAIISNEIARKYGDNGLPEDTLKLFFKGSAGQSFGAFSIDGLTMTVEGNTNDYIGKGLSGAKLIVKKPEAATFKAHENVIVGNVAFYGAIRGEAYINGLAGERFCVRNSGATAVVEGIGDHGCEYMTGGVAVILGKTGRNFAAGMSGGIAYVYDSDGDFWQYRCNQEMVNPEELSIEDEKQLVKLIQNHIQYTDSELGRGILDNWMQSKQHFIKVMPIEYKKALEKLAKLREQQQPEFVNV